ncbi:PLP-dependent aminotransferase family protein [Cohnella suwonensis]|uniref:PLP-dependent aminotransferase family protein n=1 Tax=Cohnella suwonensis TaxID=696072 RepID=A0ABW0LVW2_9BACL
MGKEREAMVTNARDVKKYLSVLSDLESKLREGHFGPGRKLPSVRAAKALYECSASTIVRAYAELEKRHAIYSIPQSGFYAVAKPGDASDREDGVRIDFASASPDEEMFPYLDFQHCLNKAIDRHKASLFAYGHPQGLDTLRQTLVSHLAGDQVFAGAEDIVVTSGAQQALEILAKMAFPGGKRTVLVEQPSYDLYLRFLEAEGIPVRGIARSAEGIDLGELETAFASGDIKFFYTMSRFHNPLGTSYREEERKTIAKLAGKYGVYIVEDDYMADLGGGRRFEPIFSYERTGRAVYVKSFSKIVFPGLRLGAVVLPEALRDAFQAHKRYGDTSLLSQAALEVYIRNGMYDRHKHTIGSRYAARMRTLNEALKKFDDEGIVEATDVREGVYVRFKLPRTVNLERMTKRLAERDILVVPGKDFYLSDCGDRDKFLRISVSRAKTDRIEEGVKAIVEEAKRCNRW